MKLFRKAIMSVLSGLSLSNVFLTNAQPKKIIPEITDSLSSHHTSGIPSESIGDIPSSETDHVLEDTLKTLVGKQLANQPGAEYSYPTINYDVLGLIIQKISGPSLEYDAPRYRGNTPVSHHDDRYFGIADKVIKMELGKIVEIMQTLPDQSSGIA